MFENQDKLKKIARDAERERVIAAVRHLDDQIAAARRLRAKYIADFGRCNAFIRDVGSSWVGCVRIQGHDGDHSEYDGPR